MDLWILFFILFFGIAGICIFIEYKKRIKKLKEIEAIKLGIKPKIIITKELLIKRNIFPAWATIICLLVTILSFVIIATNLELATTSESASLLPYIIVIIFLPIAVLVQWGKNIIYKYHIKNNKYTFKEYILKDRKISNKDKTYYFLVFKNEDEKVLTNYEDFYTSTIGDKYYVLNIFNKKQPYSTNIYELEDVSMLTDNN